MDFMVKIILVLIVVLSVLIVVLFLRQKSKKAESKQQNNDECITFECLINNLKDRKSSQSKLERTIELLIKHHGNISHQIDNKTHSDFEKYKEIFLLLCTHKNATTAMILGFDRELAKLNPEYKKDINEAIAKGLKARG